MKQLILASLMIFVCSAFADYDPEIASGSGSADASYAPAPAPAKATKVASNCMTRVNVYAHTMWDDEIQDTYLLSHQDATWLRYGLIQTGHKGDISLIECAQ